MAPTEPSLSGCRILVVEDEYLLADELRHDLTHAGAIVLGPVCRLSQALSLIDQEQDIDGAILDVNLGGDYAYAAADLLAARAVPFVFATGYDPLEMPARFHDNAICGKPVDIEQVRRAIGRVIDETR